MYHFASTCDGISSASAQKYTFFIRNSNDSLFALRKVEIKIPKIVFIGVRSVRPLKLRSLHRWNLRRQKIWNQHNNFFSSNPGRGAERENGVWWKTENYLWCRVLRTQNAISRIAMCCTFIRFDIFFSPKVAAYLQSFSSSISLGTSARLRLPPLLRIIFLSTFPLRVLTLTWKLKTGIFSWSSSITVLMAPVVESMWKYRRGIVSTIS